MKNWNEQLKSLGLLCFGIATLFLLVAGFSNLVLADDVEVTITSDSYLDYGTQNDNYGSNDFLCLTNYADAPCRMVFKVPSQLGGGNVTEVLLKVRKSWHNEADPEGLEVRAYRLLESYVESEVTWNERWSGNAWTASGGHYTTVNKGVAYMPSGNEWVTWNITDMALATWPGDLYVIVRFRYEDKYYPYATICWWLSSDYSANKPYILVSYEEETQEPDVSVDDDVVGGSFVWAEITPVLYDNEWAVLKAQCSLDGAGTWTFESSASNVTDDSPVLLKVEGLSEETAYDLRAKLVYAGGTVYSSLVDFTTLDYIVPDFSCDVSDIEICGAKLYGLFSSNNDTKDVDVRVRYKEQGTGSWSYTGWKSSSAVSDSKSWVVSGLYGGEVYEYAAQFEIENDYYLSSVSNFTTGDYVDLDCVVDDKGLDYIKLKVDYDCEDADWAEVYTRIKRDGTTNWITSNAQNVTGSGTIYVMWDGLVGGEKYFYYARADDSDGGSSLTNTSEYVYTEDIDTEPVIEDMWASFVAPYTMRLYLTIDVNDAVGFDGEIYFMIGRDICGLQKEQVGWERTGSAEVSGDGDYYVELVCGEGEFLDWESTYSFYGVFDYTVGSIETDEDCFYSGTEPFSIVTLSPRNVGDSYVTLRGFVQMGEVSLTQVAFRWWKSGEGDRLWTQKVDVSETGVFEWELDGLEYGVSYSYQFWGQFGQKYGEVVTFRAGFWESEGDVPEVVDFWADLFGGGFPIAFFKALFGLIVVVAAGGIAIWKLKGKGGLVVGLVAMAGCLILFGMIRWFPTWIIVLLAVIVAMGFLYVLKTGIQGD